MAAGRERCTRRKVQVDIYNHIEAARLQEVKMTSNRLKTPTVRVGSYSAAWRRHTRSERASIRMGVGRELSPVPALSTGRRKSAVHIYAIIILDIYTGCRRHIRATPHDRESSSSVPFCLSVFLPFSRRGAWARVVKQRRAR